MEGGGGGEEKKRLGGRCGESFLDEGSEQYRPSSPPVWELLKSQKVKSSTEEEEMKCLDSVCRIIQIYFHIMQDPLVTLSLQAHVEGCR